MEKKKIHQLQNHRHKPETKLSILVCEASNTGDFSELSDFLAMKFKTKFLEIDGRDSVGMSALHTAAACQNLHAAKLLLRHGATVDIKDDFGFSPLFLATGRYPNTELAEMLLEHKADVNMLSLTGASPLHGAALQGNVDCVKLLISHGADPHVKDEDLTTPFELAKDDQTREILHKAVNTSDAKKEEIGAVCSKCKQSSDTPLKRCGQCQVELYCSRDCQVKHWKEGHKDTCAGYVMARNQNEGHMLSMYRRMESHSNTVKLHQSKMANLPMQMEFLRGKRFIVKVQLPMDTQNGLSLVYNEDRTAQGFILSSERDEAMDILDTYRTYSNVEFSCEKSTVAASLTSS
ncbi:hypothetical protein ScPMuIL_009117 [Solemya velum]